MNTNLKYYTKSACIRKATIAFAGITIFSNMANGQLPGRVILNHIDMPKSQSVNATIDPATSSSLGVNLSLEILIKMLSELLASPVEMQSTYASLNTELEHSADLLILGYPVYGFESDLSPIEIQDGIDDGYALIDLVQENSTIIALSQESQDQLKETVECMIEELESHE